MPFLRTLALLLLFPSVVNMFATHVLGGEIRYYPHEWGLYHIDVVIWSDLNSPTDRPEIVVDFGDGTLDTVPRISIVDDPIGICSPVRISTYTAEHFYGGSGTYIIRHTDLNRSSGIVNIPDPASQAFSISASININPTIWVNTSAVFNTPQVVTEWNWSTLVHDPQASDADGDSLVFQLVVPQGLDGNPIAGYQFPEEYTSVGGFAWCDPATGAFLWDHPTLIGSYVIAIRCDEWRDGALVGQVTRDMTICVSTLPTAVPTGSTITDDMRTVQAGDQWVFENDTPNILFGELIDARGALLGTFNLPGGRTAVPVSNEVRGLTLLRTTDAEGQKRTFKLAR